MTHNGILTIFSTMRIYWPRSYAFSNNEILHTTMREWERHCQDIEDADGISAMDRLVETEEREPSFAKFRKLAMKRKVPDSQQYEDLWIAIKSAFPAASACNYRNEANNPIACGYDSNGKLRFDHGETQLEMAYNKLPEICKDYLGSSATLREMVKLGDEDLNIWRKKEFKEWCGNNIPPQLNGNGSNLRLNGVAVKVIGSK